MVTVTSWDKFKLLLWKNWLLQWNQKCQLITELLLPVVFSLLLVMVRTLVVAEPMPAQEYPSLSISDLKLFKTHLALARQKLALARTFLPRASETVGLQSALRFPEFKLLYSPNTSPVFEQIVKNAAESLQLAGYQGYANAEDLTYALNKGSYLAGVQFDDRVEYPKKLSYALRFPSELRTSTMYLPLTWLTMKLFWMVAPGPRNVNDTDGGIPVGYLREGFLPIQHAISTAYIKLASNQNSLPEVRMQRYPYPEYIDDPLLPALAGMMSLIIILSFIYPSTYITKYITTEKEQQLKEVMKIMGLDNWIHWTAWFVKAFITLGISAVLITTLMKIKWSNDVPVLSYSSFSALLFYLLVYVVTSICFCFMMATFFSKASTAAAVTGLIWFIAYLPYTFSIKTYDQLSLGQKLGWSLVSNTALGFGFKVILDLEGTGEGLQWSNMFTPVSPDDSLTLGSVILMMLASCVLYMLICLYIEQVFPGEYGVPQKWNFPFKRNFWCGEPEYMGVEDSTNGDLKQRSPGAFEVEPSGKRVGLQVKNLKKKFGDKFVVKGLSMNMYEDEITVLLGHNGAGKTTTVSMLTGMFPPTSGTAIVNGSDIRKNIQGARMSMGICPQHNVLFNDLTVANHIEFFSRLKGCRGESVNKEVDKYLKIIELQDKADVRSSKLSGGMKRKLSICCALCGGTKVVLCDEPSSGMDPAARRQLWDLLQSEKTGRTVLLTTHFMDEADVLGDRIAIMCDGELKCHGTSFFLKKKYGTGYRLICVKRENCDTNEVTALLRKYIPDIKPESDIGAELTYALPDAYSSVYEEMLTALEENAEGLNLNGYGIGITSLEEVFMKVGAESANDGTRKEPSAIMNGGSGYQEDDLESIQSERPFSDKTDRLEGAKLCLGQWHAMFLKKILYTLRNRLLFLIQNAMPIFFVVVTILIARRQGTFNILKPITISQTQYPTTVTVLERDASLNNLQPDAVEIKIADHYKSLANSYGSAHQFDSTGTSNFSEYILKLGKTIQVRINSRYVAAATIAKGKITAWLNNQPLHTAPLTVNMVHNAMAKALVHPDAEITVANAPLPYTTETKLVLLNVGNNLGTQLATNLCFCMCFVSALYILFLIRERECRAKLLQFVGGVNVWTFWLTQLLWDMATFTLTAVIVIATVACFQEEGFAKFSDLGRYFLIMLIFGFSVLPFTYLVSFFFSEPATGYARMSIINIFTGMALFIVILVMSIDYFDTKDTADSLQWFFRVFPHFSLAMSLNKLYMNVATRNACGNELIKVLPDTLRCKLVPKCCKTTPYLGWVEPGIMPEILYLAVTAVVFFTVLIMRDYGLFSELSFIVNFIKNSLKGRKKPPRTLDDGLVDADIREEMRRVQNMSEEEIARQNLVLDRVSKTYNGFVAVNKISMCVKQTECFGLLGVNGAGKTSTFKMMTGDEKITSGAAYVKGMSLKKDMNKIYQEIGYCPQFDALLGYMTGRETLKIFCLLRGIEKKRIPAVSEELGKSFGFIKHMDKETRTYSGGNKRKLSTALAVIGGPSVIYLDEPTTGVDPAARRQLWNVVCRIRDSGKSIVLTSHSMEECEALCTRLAIMVNGEFKCIGSTQHLKNKFSKGLILKIKVKRVVEGEKEKRSSLRDGDDESMSTPVPENDVRNVKQFVKTEFPDAILQEEYQDILTFYIPLVSIKWSKIFGLMERNHDRLKIEDYSISQTTLEEIFLEFAKKQRGDSRVHKTKNFCFSC